MSVCVERYLPQVGLGGLQTLGVVLAQAQAVLGPHVSALTELAQEGSCVQWGVGGSLGTPI